MLKMSVRRLRSCGGGTAMQGLGNTLKTTFNTASITMKAA